MNDIANPAIITQLQSLLGPEHVLTDATEREFHSTDVYARGQLPLAVVRPASTSDVAQLVQLCTAQGVSIVPRGGGTGYTGGPIPLTWKSAVINTEKLEAMSEVEFLALPGLAQPVATVWTEAGVVTQRVADAAERAGHVFAVEKNQGTVIWQNPMKGLGYGLASFAGAASSNQSAWLHKAKADEDAQAAAAT